MFVEIMSASIVGGLWITAKISERGGSGDDHRKIQKICANCGLTVKEKGNVKHIRLHRKKKGTDYTEYIYQIPLGLSFKDFEQKKQHIQDGLNIKKTTFAFNWGDIKQLHFDKSILQQIKQLLAAKQKLNKEVELSYDGMLRIKVFHYALTDFLIFDETMLKACKSWEVPVGQSRTSFLYHDFEYGHMIVAGVTRYGKSVFLKNIITSLIYRKPNDAKFTLIDLKGGLTFARYQNLSQVLTVAKNPVETLDALKEIQHEMYERQERFLENGWEDIKEAKMKERHFIIVDEAASISSAGITDKEEKKMRIECETILAEIARVGAGLGYRLIVCTQYPTADTLPRQVKQNADTKICFRLQTAIASNVVLDQDGAEKLPKIKGRAIYLGSDGKEVVQTPFIENKQIQEIVAPYITIKARKENECATSDTTRAENREHTLIIEETELS